jgi:hypothetical protein
MFPTRNKDIALYNNVLNNAADIYFSVKANMVIAEKPTATKVKYNFFSPFILSLGIILSLSVSIYRSRQAAGTHGFPQASRKFQPLVRHVAFSGCLIRQI